MVAQLVEAFCEDWLFTTGETLGGDAWFPEPAAAGQAISRVITSGPDQDLEKLEFMLLSASRRRAPLDQDRDALFLTRRAVVEPRCRWPRFRGVHVDIVLPGRSNHRLVDWATEAQMRPLLEAGVRVWHQPPPFDHSKLMIVDGAWCLIGSANWDMRSLRLNFEIDLEVYDEAFAARLDATIAPKLGHRVSAAELDRRSFPIVLRDAAVRLLLPYL